ncbi:MAG: hypothetical protein JNL10_11405 [Verrucomicrobiales bacterium]|nr:hypothetical protein [Verrucomicrobiales bacterium]
MWIASKVGFFSLVTKDGHLHVRARLRRDLENLLALPGIPQAAIESWPQADYRWRVRLDPGAAGAVLGALSGTIDYPNFKSEVARRPDQRAKLPAYHDLWHGLFELQG